MLFKSVLDRDDLVSKVLNFFRVNLSVVDQAIDSVVEGLDVCVALRGIGKDYPYVNSSINKGEREICSMIEPSYPTLGRYSPLVG